MDPTLNEYIRWTTYCSNADLPRGGAPCYETPAPPPPLWRECFSGTSKPSGAAAKYLLRNFQKIRFNADLTRIRMKKVMGIIPWLGDVDYSVFSATLVGATKRF